MQKLYVVNPGLGDRLVVNLAGVVGLADVYVSPDALTQGGAWRQVLDGVGDGSYIITDLTENQWYLVCLVDAEGIAEHYARERPTNFLPYYSLELERESLETYVAGRTIGYRLIVNAINPIRMTDKVFLYERQPHRTEQDEERDIFVSVCSPGDLSAYPIDQPGSGEGPPLYRLSYVDLVFRSTQGVEDTWEALWNDVQELVIALENIRILSRSEVRHVWAGRVQPLPSSSSSISPSSSSSSSSSSLSPSP